MILSVTQRCNMLCPFCSNESGPTGNDMSLETFTSIVAKFGPLLRKRGEPLCPGGGEPTLHPQLFEFIKIARDAGIELSLSTNGKLPEPALRLCAMAKRGELQAILSLSRLREKTSPAVIKAFLSEPRLRRSPTSRARDGWRIQNNDDPSDKRVVSILAIPVPWGRALKNNLPTVPRNGDGPPSYCRVGRFQVRWNGDFCVCGGKWGGCYNHEFVGNILDDAAVQKYLPVFDEPWEGC